MAAVPQKRKRFVLTLGTKLEIVRALESGSSQRVVGDKFGVAKSTVAEIRKYCQKISDSVAASESPGSAKRRCIVRDMPYMYMYT